MKIINSLLEIKNISISSLIKQMFRAVLRIRIRIPARFWLPGKYADPRIRIQGAKYQSKTAHKKINSKNQNLNY